MNLQRENHYLPKCYQQGFTDSGGKVWVKFANKEPEQRNPDSVGKQRNLYVRRNVNGGENDSIEKFLGRTIETPFASLSKRIKEEGGEFSDINAVERLALLMFVASQAVRTKAHKRCVDIQAGTPVAQDVFLDVMLRQTKTIVNLWLENPPLLRFFTTLPYVGERFIAGDNPVVVLQVLDNRVWTPTDNPKAQITPLDVLLNSPNVGFWLPLSPYICVSIQPRNGVAIFVPPQQLELSEVRMLNQLLRGQCHDFVLARDRESLS
jgi:hypothetical protein